ncbi:MAG: GH116 family glycosyl-hydrolase [Capsulimonadales bacterium]|nr:GH116 family glycosyl-hydrolase [Capsulimonadales bacterium]
MTVSWPVLTRYDRDHLAKIALPLGGIGTGTISLGGRGDLRDFEVAQRPAKGFTPPNAFFALRLATSDGGTVVRCLEGPIDPALYEGGFGSPAANHGLPRFRDAEFEAAYPLGQVLLSDPDIPLSVRLQALNPLIPPDADRSGLPVALLRYVVRNPNDDAVTVSIVASLPNFIGNDGKNALAHDNRNEWRLTPSLCGVFLRSDGVPADAETSGTLALTTPVTEDSDITYRLGWPRKSWNGGLLDFWDDFHQDGRLESEVPGPTEPNAALCVRRTIAPGETSAFVFFLTWHFPNRSAWEGGGTVGNYYATQFSDAWAVAERVAAEREALEADTVAFVTALVEADLPAVVKEAALYNVSTLRSQTTFRLPDGRLFGWEGCHDRDGCCHGTCTHVWNYEVTTPFLFGSLARTMREVEFGFATDGRGHMAFRVHLPLADETRRWNLAAADGQMGCLMKLYREWRLSGDDDFLRRLWPRAKQAMAFCWIPGGWDADQDGLMEGCQHNTMDVEYYGPNPQMGAWYLGALRAVAEMARYLNEGEFAERCERLFRSGSALMDRELFNGDYYEHRILPPSGPEDIAPGLRHDSMGAKDVREPDLQLGAGCLIDQLVGQYLAHVCGLGYLLAPENVRRTLDSLMRFNFRESMHGHFNHLRTFALGNESAMLMATYPKGGRPKQPFPYYNEVMTGFEHQAAAHMLFEGQRDAGLKLLSAVRARYDGRKRSPFNEAECGHHYARAMASWAYILALTGFRYDGKEQSLRFAAPDAATTRWFWSNGDAWGTITLTATGSERAFLLTVGGGTLRVRTVGVDGWGDVSDGSPEARTLSVGETRAGSFPPI